MAPEAAILAARAAGVSFHADAATRASAARDFGGVASGDCLLSAEPSTPEACARLVLELGRRGLGCTIRGAGYSQSGQSVAAGTVSLCTRRLDSIGPIDPERRQVSVGAGATWRQVVASSKGSFLVPPVLPLNLDMTVGGLLSAGGVGATSHRRGPVIANVARLEVVTGDGVLRSCSRQSEAALFDAVRGGAGQAGVIVGATLELVPAPRKVRVLSYLYADAAVWLEDQLAASEVDPGLHIEGFCWATARGAVKSPSGLTPSTRWMFGLNLGVGEDVEPAAMDGWLSRTRPSQAFEVYEMDFYSYLERYEPRFAGMVQEGNWTEAHPWFEAIVPVEASLTFLSRLLERLPPNVGDGHRFTLLDARGCPRHFGAAVPSRSAVIGVFPPAIGRHALAKTERALAALNSLVLDAGGRRYMSGWLGQEPGEYLSAHFDGDVGAGGGSDWAKTRREYDPSGVFRSALFPFGHRGARVIGDAR